MSQEKEFSRAVITGGSLAQVTVALTTCLPITSRILSADQGSVCIGTRTPAVQASTTLTAGTYTHSQGDAIVLPRLVAKVSHSDANILISPSVNTIPGGEICVVHFESSGDTPT